MAFKLDTPSMSWSPSMYAAPLSATANSTVLLPEVNFKTAYVFSVVKDAM